MQNLKIIIRWNYRYTKKIFSTDIPNDSNIYDDNIAAKKDNYVIIPETIHELNVLWNDALFCGNY